MGFLEDYFVAPIMERTGYNLVNTLVYVAIAVAAVYAIFQIFRKHNIKIDRQFFWGTLTFVLFGSTARVVTDAVDSGVFTAVTPLHRLILETGIYKYGFFTVTPGIYVVVAAIFLSTFAILNYLRKVELLPWIGLALFAFHLALLLPFMEYAWLAPPVLAMALVPAYVIYRKYGAEGAAVVFGHGLDGAATFMIIDVFPSTQQAQIRTQFSETIQAVMSQRLFKRRDGTGRVAALEIMIGTPAIRNLIRENKISQIPSAMQTGQKFGMQTMEAAIKELI
ncbi:MAG: DUF63 family protein, partial [Candidatus Bilamarchaeaceae archaeon]